MRHAPAYYALGQGRYWLKDLGYVDGHASDSTTLGRGEEVLALPLPEGTFRLLMTPAGDSLLLQQQVAGAWHSQLHLSLRATTDSLLQRYGRHHASSVDLPAPVVLRMHADRLQLRLFMTSLNRSQTGQEARYSYSLEGELHIRP